MNPGKETGQNSLTETESRAAAATRLIRVAGGSEAADLILANVNVVDVIGGEIYRAAVALAGDRIAGIGSYERGRQTIDLTNKYLIPGLIDGHIHLESSMLTPEGFAEAVIPHGTTAVIADPHEIVNVCGMEGFAYMIDASRDLPLDFFFSVPSCVPATAMETAGADFGIAQIEEAWRLHPQSPALGEMMNFPGVINGIPEVLAKIQAAHHRGKRVDGHAPLLTGKALNAYISAGISSDHECTNASEALEKLRLGVTIAVREGSAAKNLAALLPLINDYNCAHFFFCCDDQNPHDLLQGGHIAGLLRKAVKLGLNPIRAVSMATVNTARHYRLTNRGVIAPGYLADLVVVDNLEEFGVEMVFKNGAWSVQPGTPYKTMARKSIKLVAGSVQIPVLENRLKTPSPNQASIANEDAGQARQAGQAMAKVIEIIPGQLLTGCRMMSAREIATDQDVNLIAVVERHGRNGNVAVGYVKGFGPLKGALASTVAHDSHNLILVGPEPQQMIAAATVAKEMSGGLAVVQNGQTLSALPLPAAGLMSDLDASAVASRQEDLHRAAAAIGCTLPEPFMTMSFLSLPVIPSLKITDYGLIDVDTFKVVDLWTSKE